VEVVLEITGIHRCGQDDQVGLEVVLALSLARTTLVVQGQQDKEMLVVIAPQRITVVQVVEVVLVQQEQVVVPQELGV
jgi:hypothetical protein